jgi:hypothetical protein
MECDSLVLVRASFSAILGKYSRYRTKRVLEEPPRVNPITFTVIAGSIALGVI